MPGLVATRCLAVLLVFVLPRELAGTKPSISPDAKEIIINEGEPLKIVCTSYDKIFFSYPEDIYDEAIETSEPDIQEVVEGGQQKYIFQRNNTIFGDTGWYGCADHFFESTIEEYTNPDINWIYVYVKSEKSFFAQVSLYQHIRAVENKDAIIPCRPTSPEYNVTLQNCHEPMDFGGRVAFNPRIGFTFRNVTPNDTSCIVCEITARNDTQTIAYTILVYRNLDVPKPKIQTDGLRHVVRGQDLQVNCSILLDLEVLHYAFNWTTPQQSSRITSRHHDVAQGNVREVVSELTIRDVQYEDQGQYVCHIQAPFSNISTDTTYLTVYDPSVSYINLTSINHNKILQSKLGDRVQWIVYVDAYPQPRYRWLNREGEEILGNWMDPDNAKYAINYTQSMIVLRINHLDINDMGNYTFQAAIEDRTESLNFRLEVISKPVPIIVDRGLAYYAPKQNVKMHCRVAAYPEPNITWSFLACPNYPSRKDSILVNLKGSRGSWDKTSFESVVEFSVEMSGQLSCQACNALGCDWAAESILVSDGNGGFGIIEPQNQITEGDFVELICAASIYNYTSTIQWCDENDSPIQVDDRITIRREKTPFTYRSILTINGVRKSDSMYYVCEGTALDMDGMKDHVLYNLIVHDPVPPYFKETNLNRSEIVVDLGTDSHKTVIMKCIANGMPQPNVTWYKDDKPLLDSEQYFFLFKNQELHIQYLLEKDSGKYLCRAENRLGKVENYQIIAIKSKDIPKGLIVSIVLLTLAVIGFAIFFSVRIRRERRIRKELMETGLMHFAEGAVECLNPELTVDDQAELLPYDNKWEFPRERLKIGMQLGSGAFGVVAKAEAQGICENEVVTTVAVKMVRHTTDPTYVRALASELKIMVHLGKHLNVVNLLGACTKNIYKRELLVIVEYCRYGNLHNYLLRHRKSFINQIDPVTGKFDPTIGIDQINRSVSVSSNSSLSVNSDMGTDSHGMPMSPIDSCVLSNNSIQPGWRSNYRGDYKENNLKPICTQDLLSWAFQVARGMEYLSHRRVLHGDLAARNILLAENNIVKICDFGLAKTMYKDDNYKKKADGPLPIKWMAIESIRDRIFSTQSDIWSFGIVLWEFFTLAETPYPGMEAEKLYQKLIEGYRMEQPEYATKEVYDIMRQCWKAKPSLRPGFTELVNDIGHLLEESVRSHYVSLNDPYMDMNTMNLGEGKSDYLTMMSSPDHAALSSPMTKDYVNSSVLNENADNSPSYLCMSPTPRSPTDDSEIFSPRPKVGDTRFDFPSPGSDSEDAVEISPMLQKPEEDPYLKPIDVNQRRAEFARHRQSTKSVESDWIPNGGQENQESGYCNAPRNLHLIDLNEQEKQSTTDDVDNTNETSRIKSNFTPTIIRTQDNYVNMPRQKSDLKKEMPGGFSNPSYAMIPDKDVIQTRV